MAQKSTQNTIKVITYDTKRHLNCKITQEKTNFFLEADGMKMSKAQFERFLANFLIEFESAEALVQKIML